MTMMLEATPAGTGPVHYSGTLGTSDTALYTESGPGVILSGIFCQNITGSDAQLTLTVHRAPESGAIEPLVTRLDIPAGSAGPAVGMTPGAYCGVLLRTGDSLHGSASAAGAVAVIAYE